MNAPLFAPRSSQEEHTMLIKSLVFVFCLDSVGKYEPPILNAKQMLKYGDMLSHLCLQPPDKL